MRKWLLIPFMLIFLSAGAQTLFTYGKYKVSKEAFLNAFNKNKTTADDKDPNALENYLKLYITFKLKVQDALDHGIDTLPSIQADLHSFESQIMDNYTYDQKEFDFLLNQALDRSKKDIYLTGYRLQSSSSDTLMIKKMADILQSRLVKHLSIDENSLKKNGVDLIPQDFGYSTVFSLPYHIENIVYQLNPGEYSKAFSFNGNYYILKNEKERPGAGKIKIAQILIAIPQGDTSFLPSAKHLADSLYNLLKNGANFADLAKEFSDDRNSYLIGGEMPSFEVGTYSPDFEEHAFALKKDGEIPEPFLTSFGYHIIKRISATPIPEKFSDEYVYNMEQKLMKDDRMQLARDILLNHAKILTGFTILPFDKEDMYKITDSLLISSRDLTLGKLNGNSDLFRFNDKSITNIKDWVQYLRNSGRVEGGSLLHTSYDKLWPDFINYSIMRNYSSRLATFDKDYAEQIRNFNEGNMLFEMMQHKVWNKAAKDSVGLEKYYQAHKEKYLWGKSADAIIFSCNNAATANECAKELTNSGWKEVMENHKAFAQADSARFEWTQLPIHDQNVHIGTFTVVVNPQDSTASFAQVIHVYPAGMQRSFEDARGLVTEDYQKILERQWIDQLKGKYPLKVNQQIWDSIKKENHNSGLTNN